MPEKSSWFKYILHFTFTFTFTSNSNDPSTLNGQTYNDKGNFFAKTEYLIANNLIYEVLHTIRT